MRIYENKPLERNRLCMEMSGELSPRPFSSCKECKYRSHSSCTGKENENFAKNVKKSLQSF